MTTQTANLVKFRKVYADAVVPISILTQAEFNAAMEQAGPERELAWHGERMPLGEAAEQYAEIVDGYNDFKPNMLKDLAAAFPDNDIEVTPARESSVAVYLHIPTGRQIVRAWIEQNLNADEVDFVTKFSCLQDGEVELVGEALRVWWD